MRSPRFPSFALSALLVFLCACHQDEPTQPTAAESVTQDDPTQPTAAESVTPALPSSTGGEFAYVTNGGSNNVSVIATATNTVTDTVPPEPIARHLRAGPVRVRKATVGGTRE
jgi:YVTN family beta-propeller protein